MINWIKQKFSKTQEPLVLTTPIEHKNKVSVIKKAAKLSEPKKPRGRPKKKTD